MLYPTIHVKWGTDVGLVRALNMLSSLNKDVITIMIIIIIANCFPDFL